MRLYIAEKPSLGRAIANAISSQAGQSGTRGGQGFIRLADGNHVSWCIGHLLEQAEPEVYDANYKRWSHEHLPIVPDEWKLKPRKTMAAQLKVLRQLVKEADELVHAGDPDREGQLLVDEVIHFLGVKGKKLAAVQRCLINDLNPAAVRRSLDNLRPNSEFKPLSTSALARSRADWLYGINMTRAYTLQGQKAGYRGVLSVGRVQTPVLGLVVRRDLDIANFVSKPFYEVWAHLDTDAGESFTARWIPSKACEPYLDEAKRNLSKPLAENVARRISHKPASVKSVERKKRVLAPTLPYNLSALQMDANRAFSLSAQEVLDTCQALYEKHKLITYPRSDCRYLPEEHFKEAPAIIETIQQNLDNLGLQDYKHNYSVLDASRKTKAWNDKKVDAHHAIIPTLRRTAQLSRSELSVYQLICRQYLIQFLPDHVFYETRADINIESGLFVARAKEPSIEGWKLLFRKKISDVADEALLPALKKNQALQSKQAEIKEKNTTPPAHFTEATLLAAMTGINHFVGDATLKKILRDTDGLGTEATRAGIIELLMRRQFLERKQKSIRATPTGIALIQALPETATLPDMTARWEAGLTEISQNTASYDSLMAPLEAQLRVLISESRTILPKGLQGLGNQPIKSTKRRSGTKTKKSSQGNQRHNGQTRTRKKTGSKRPTRNNKST